MKFIVPEKYPELFEVMGSAIFNALLRRGIEQEEANVIALEATEAGRTTCGGGEIYVSKGVSYEMFLRNEEIWGKFTGNNETDLAREYELSTRQILSILAERRAYHRARAQLSLLPASPTDLKESA